MLVFSLLSLQQIRAPFFLHIHSFWMHDTSSFALINTWIIATTSEWTSVEGMNDQEKVKKREKKKSPHTLISNGIPNKVFHQFKVSRCERMKFWRHSGICVWWCNIWTYSNRNMLQLECYFLIPFQCCHLFFDDHLYGSIFCLLLFQSFICDRPSFIVIYT